MTNPDRSGELVTEPVHKGINQKLKSHSDRHDNCEAEQQNQTKVENARPMRKATSFVVIDLRCVDAALKLGIGTNNAVHV
jgi:hypothetical protein